MAIAAKKATAAPQLTAQQKLQQLIKSTPAPAVTAPRPMASAVPTGPTITAVKGPAPVGQSVKQQAEAQRAAQVAAQQAAARQAQQVAAQQAAARAQQVAAQAAAAQQAQQQRVQQIQQQLAPKPAPTPAPVQTPIQKPAPVQQAPAPVQQPVQQPAQQAPTQNAPTGDQNIIGFDLMQTPEFQQIKNQHPGWTYQMFGSSMSPGGWRDETGQAVNADGSPNYGGLMRPPAQTPQPMFNLPNPVATPAPEMRGSLFDMPRSASYSDPIIGTPNVNAPQGSLGGSLFNAPPTQQQPVQNPPTGLNNMTPGTPTPGQPTGLLPDNNSNFGQQLAPVQQPVTQPTPTELTGIINPGQNISEQLRDQQAAQDMYNPDGSPISGTGPWAPWTPQPIHQGIQSLASLAPGAGGIYGNQPTSVL